MIGSKIGNIFFTLLFLGTTGPINGQTQAELVIFNTFDDKQISFKEIVEKSKEKLVILYTWVKICKPCLESLDNIDSAFNDFKNQNFKFYSVNIDKFSVENTNRSYFQFKTELELLDFVKKKDWYFETIYEPKGTYIKYALNNEPGVPQFWVFYKGYLLQYEYTYLTLPEFFGDFIRDIINSFQKPVNRILYYPALNGTKQILQDYSFNNGMRTGIWKSYHRDPEKKIVLNQLEYIRQYDDHGRPIGKWVIYYGNGKTKEVMNYNNGKLDGEYLLYFDNGKLKIKGQYSVGRRIGLWETYDREGKLKENKNF